MTEPRIGRASNALPPARRRAKRPPRIRALSAAIDRPSDLYPSQAAHWFALALDFRPEAIIELGRGAGNSTAIFTEAAHRIGTTVVKSFDLNPGWTRERAVAEVVGKEWFRPLEILTCDIAQVDFLPHIQNARRVLVLWDAHGFEVSDAVLGRLLPLIADKEHLVVCHDISDNRVCNPERSYQGRPFWRGSEDYYEHLRTTERARTNLFWVNTIVDQAIPILDFCWRNGIELHSADYDYHRATVTHPDLTRAVRDTWPDDLFQEVNHWAYFSLNESHGERFFPVPVPVSDARKLLGQDTAAELRAVHDSISWKVTAPLRALGRLFGRK